MARRGELEALAARLCERKGVVRLTGLRGSARAVVGAELVRAQAGRAVLFLTPTAKAGDALLGDLCTTLGDSGAQPQPLVFPRHDTLPYDRFSPQPFLVVQRMGILYRWLKAGDAAGSEGAGPVVVAPWTALALRVPPPASLRAHTVTIGVGQRIDRDALVAGLVSSGYARMALVEEAGEFAVRGGILDLFPPQCTRPVRIELLGDEVESIREFDALSQRSRAALERIDAPPTRELLFDRETVIAQGEAIRELALERGADDRSADELIDALLRGHVPPGTECVAPLLCPKLACVLDFVPDDAMIVIDDAVAARDRLRHYGDETREGFGAALEAKRIVCSPEALLFDAEALEARLQARSPVLLERPDIEDDSAEEERVPLRCRGSDALRRDLARSRTADRALEPLVDRLAGWMSEGWRTVLACRSLSAAERLRSLLADYGIEARGANDARPVWAWSRAGRVEVRVAPLAEGFELPSERFVVVTEEEIFGPREKRRSRRRWREGAVLEAIAQLSPGDFVVHDEHGIGIFRGLTSLDVGYGRAAGQELLLLEYLGGDRLFLPVHRLNHVQGYTGADGVAPRLDRLGGQTWERAKRKVKKSLRNMARQLLTVQAAREVASGFSFSPRDAHFEEFEAGFPFDETPDQAAAIEDVVADMQRPRPMDRLVCGDVGYGKTEVALRAAFRAVMDGKQVAVLVPTTVLCQQHVATFRERFRGYPIRVESLSRFCEPAEARATIAGLASGEIDVVIGTHRLLQKAVSFRELGLLVVDEEHRFGVAHKERIKQLRKNVDVLTLTATPIPRTLQMAFTGLRDLSVIETPPVDRLAIRTQTCRFSESLVREAILREVRRGGQVFYVRNRVRGIGGVAEMLARVVPEVKVVVAHGQLKERELEQRMLAFLQGQADVLLCTTIIESGLDIPRANTILIDRAHALGLAQLYQLRGRVGRSNHRAYAYLLVPHRDALSREAQQRLEAIQDLSELGSGFRLASMDLEIRGAGNLLGGEQSGNLVAVGYETYMEMLEETIEELRGQIRRVEVDPEIRLPVPARLPEDYVPEVSQRLVLYKRLAGARSDAELAPIRDEILDRYGHLPPEGVCLLEVIAIKLRARQLGVGAVELARGELVLRIADPTKLDPARMVGLMTGADPRVRVSPDHTIYAPCAAVGGPKLLAAARRLLDELTPAAVSEPARDGAGPASR